MLLKVQIYDSQSQENILVVNQRENDKLHHCVNVEFSWEVIYEISQLWELYYAIFHCKLNFIRGLKYMSVFDKT
jgi:hypothetical protein